MILIITIGVTRVLITNRVENDSLSFRLMKGIVYCYAFEFQSLEIIFEQFKYGINLNQKNINRLKILKSHYNIYHNCFIN